LALALAAAILFVIANTLPLMDLSVVGRSTSTTIAGGASEMWLRGDPVTGVLVAFCAVLAPAGYLLCVLALLVAARCSPAPAWAAYLIRWLRRLQAWSMLEVMLLGILVALMKIAQTATVETGLGMLALGTLVILYPAILQKFNVHEIARKIVWTNGATPRAQGPHDRTSDPAQ
jgi:paraquat-inducible protein A